LEESIETNVKKMEELGKEMASIKEQIKEPTTINLNHIHLAMVDHFFGIQKKKEFILI
jgi:hypothetical protein